MTWLLVTTWPSGSMMKPEPRARGFWPGSDGAPGAPNGPGCPSKKRRKNSPKGESGGTGIGRSSPGAPSCDIKRIGDFCTVAMLTTAGVTCSARSAKLAGAGRATATDAVIKTAIAVRTMTKTAGRWADSGLNAAAANGFRRDERRSMARTSCMTLGGADGESAPALGQTWEANMTGA